MYCRNCGAEMNAEAAICVKCGVPAGKGKGYCPACGEKVPDEAVICVNCGASLQNKIKTNIAPRNLVTAIILSLITCGIYGMYWLYKLNDEVCEMAGETAETSSGTVVLLTLITCGIYGIYWSYKMGVKQDAIEGNNSSRGILYLVISLIGFSIVVYALLQDMINRASERK